MLFDSLKYQTEFIGLLPSGTVVDGANFEELALLHGDHMNKVKYLNEVEKRLCRIFLASKEGFKASPVERHRLEGFMRAGIFLGIASNEEMSELMDACHSDIFGKTIEQRKAELSARWQEESIDYSHYDQPAYERKGLS